MADEACDATGNVVEELTLLRTALDRLPALVGYWDASQRCGLANRAYETWFGVAPEALVGMELCELLGPLYPLNRPYIEAALAGTPQHFEREIVDPQGGPPRLSQATYMPHVVDGKVLGFFVHVVDVTPHGAPATRDTPPPPPATPRASERPRERQGTRGRALVVDDEPLIATMVARVLEFEYEVTTATNGREALALVLGSTFDVIFADLMMPEMTGMELHAALLEASPDHADRMVFMSGGAYTPSGRTFLRNVPNPRLEKPLEMSNLMAIARGITAEARANALLDT